MKNKLDLFVLEARFNSIVKNINDCMFSFTPKARRLKKELDLYLSDLNFVKNLSYSFKLDIESLKLEYPISEDLLFEVNASIFELELDLVNLSKFSNKIDIMSRWFKNYADLNSFIVQNSSKKYIHKTESLNQQELPTSEPKIIKFSHLL